MRLIFLGTPVEASRTLRALHNAGHEIVLVVTQPDRKRGRGSALIETPVKQVANELGLRVTHKMKDIPSVEADVGICVQFGRLLKEPVLSQVPWINLHPSLLPRWRGSSPVESAILAGDADTGVCVMQLIAEMDAGGIYKSWTTQIDENETSTELSDRLFEKGTQLLLELLAEGIREPTPQTSEPTFAGKFTPNDFRLDFSRSAVECNRIIRLGRAWTTLDGKRFRILKATVEMQNEGLKPGALESANVGTGDGALKLVTVQPENKAPMDVTAWLNGRRGKTTQFE